MIPKRIFFYWAGGPIPWLRMQSILSFQRLHPGWEVILGSPEAPHLPPGVRLVVDTVSAPNLPNNVRSDVWRWHMLAEFGGVYSDMDVVFIRNIEPLFNQDKPDAWLTMDMGTPVVPPSVGKRDSYNRRIRKPGMCISIGVIGSKPGSLFFRRAADASRNTPGRPGYFTKNPSSSQDYQSHGTHLLKDHWADFTKGVVMGNIPASAFYRGSSPVSVRLLWRGKGELGPNEFGVHWYGGSSESIPYEYVGSELELSACLVRKALEMRHASKS